MTSSVSSDVKNIPSSQVITGPEHLVDSEFSILSGKRVGLISNQTGLVRGKHLADLMHKDPTVDLGAIYAPEHGFRGITEAGATVRDGTDTKTGVRVFSLYGKSKKPTQRMLKNIDVLVFDIQDIGVRFYTYISTMGLAMQAAAKAGIPFIVLDRPNPLGGDYVAGFLLEPKLRSFVGQYPIPIVHGLTVGELAQMIKGQKWLRGLEKLDLRIVKLKGWTRSMRWPELRKTWIATSPNIPTYASALSYPGIGIVGETQLVNEGRGTSSPFTLFGAPWLNSNRIVRQLNAKTIQGVKFKAVQYKPVSIPRVATKPRFVGQSINGVQITVTDISRYKPLETGIHVLALLIAEARIRGVSDLFRNLPMFHRISGTRRLHRMLVNGSSSSAIIAAWRTEVSAFRTLRKQYLLY